MQRSVRDRRSTSVERPKNFFISTGLIVILLVFLYKYWNASTLVNYLLTDQTFLKSELNIKLEENKILKSKLDSIKTELMKCENNLNSLDEKNEEHVKLLSEAKIELNDCNTERKNDFSDAQLKLCDNVQLGLEDCKSNLIKVQTKLNILIQSQNTKEQVILTKKIKNVDIKEENNIGENNRENSIYDKRIRVNKSKKTGQNKKIKDHEQDRVYKNNHKNKNNNSYIGTNTYDKENSFRNINLIKPYHENITKTNGEEENFDINKRIASNESNNSINSKNQSKSNKNNSNKQYHEETTNKTSFQIRDNFDTKFDIDDKNSKIEKFQIRNVGLKNSYLKHKIKDDQSQIDIQGNTGLTESFKTAKNIFLESEIPREYFKPNIDIKKNNHVHKSSKDGQIDSKELNATKLNDLPKFVGINIDNTRNKLTLKKNEALNNHNIISIENKETSINNSKLKHEYKILNHSVSILNKIYNSQNMLYSASLIKVIDPSINTTISNRAEVDRNIKNLEHDYDDD